MCMLLASRDSHKLVCIFVGRAELSLVQQKIQLVLVGPNVNLVQKRTEYMSWPASKKMKVLSFLARRSKKRTCLTLARAPPDQFLRASPPASEKKRPCYDETLAPAIARVLAAMKREHQITDRD